jgi:hypothetical protein
MMTRLRRRAVVALVCAAAGGLLAWFVLGRQTPRRGPNLDLQVNLRNNLEVSPGTPLTFDVVLSAGRAVPRTSVGGRWRSWSDLVRLELSDGTTIPWTLERVAVRTADVIKADGQVLVEEAEARIALIEGSRYLHVMTLSVGPDATTNVGGRTFHVRAVLETPWWMFTGWRGRAASRAVTITVRPVDTSDSLGRTREEERISRSASYYLRKNQFAEARTFAQQLVDRRPDVADNHVILADALAALDQPVASLAAYQNALRLLSPSYEEPVLLRRRIADVERRSRK